MRVFPYETAHGALDASRAMVTQVLTELLEKSPRDSPLHSALNTGV